MTKPSAPPPELTPPLELVHQWADMLSSRSDQAVFTMAAQWGAKQELEACVNWLIENQNPRWALALRIARRPKPPSLKEQALAVITNAAICDHLSPEDEAILRRALEALPND